MNRKPIKRKPSTLDRKPLRRAPQAPKRPTGAPKKAKTRNVSKKKKTSRRELWGQYGLEVPKYIRYKGLPGVLWWVLSRYVRITEFNQYGGVCVDGCGIPILDWREADAGHFRSAKSLSTRFRRENLGIQRKHCNSPRGGNGRQYDFGKEVDKRYGTGTADRLTELAAQTTAPFKDAWYDQEIRRILKLLETVDNAQNTPNTLIQ